MILLHNNHYSIKLKVIIVFFTILMIFLIFYRINLFSNKNKKFEQKQTEFINKIDKNSIVNISKFATYGTHLNIEGSLEYIKLSGIRIDQVDLVLTNIDNGELLVKSKFNYSDNKISFSTFETINTGIDLENLQIDNYYILLKVTYSNSDIKYYSLKNTSTYNDITYYTITKNNSNNKLDIHFSSLNEIPVMKIDVLEIDNLPENIYDIAIDPGHGGLDKGDTFSNYSEAELMLKCGLELKQQLEALGLKVFISRNVTENSNEDTTTSMYDENGRINILNKSNAKLLISLHMEDSAYTKNNSGISVYIPSNCTLDLASSLAKNIVETANSIYSPSLSFKEAERSIYQKLYKIRN